MGAPHRPGAEGNGPPRGDGGLGCRAGVALGAGADGIGGRPDRPHDDDERQLSLPQVGRVHYVRPDHGPLEVPGRVGDGQDL